MSGVESVVPFEKDLISAVNQVYAWLVQNVQFFKDYPELGDPADMLAHIASVGLPQDSEKREEAMNQQRFLLFMGYRDDEPVCAGLRQLGPKDIALMTYGVADKYQHSGVGRATLKWFFSGLHKKHARGTARFGTMPGNTPQLEFAKKHGAIEVPPDKWWAGTSATNHVEWEFPITKSCECLRIKKPHLTNYRFEPCSGDDKRISFKILYFGRHPRRLKPGKRPMIPL